MGNEQQPAVVDEGEVLLFFIVLSACLRWMFSLGKFEGRRKTSRNESSLDRLRVVWDIVDEGGGAG